MQDDRYHWQDHVPASIDWKAYLAFGAVFAAFLIWAGVERKVTAEALHDEALISIVETRLAKSDALSPSDNLFVRHESAPPATTHDQLFCALKRVVL